jgi:hypothetical protein
LAPRPRYALVSFSLGSRNSLIRLRLDLRDPSTRFSRPLPSLREFGLQTREPAPGLRCGRLNSA